jgi:RNA polymerase sigma-70 factor (ECF subfamily)
VPADATPNDDPRSDEHLVKAANAGDASAFESLYHRHKPWVASLATRFTGDPDLALDVVQETFIYLLSKFPGFKLTSRMTTFLYPAVKNLSIGLRRKRGKFMGGDAPLDALAVPAPGSPDEIAAVIKNLPDLHREVVLLRFVDGFSLDEIATALGIPSGTVKSRLHNALAALRADPAVRNFFDPA